MRLRPLFKPILNRVLPPVTRWFLRKPRRFKAEGLEMIIYPGVFHPGMYFSTRFLLEELKGRPWNGIKVWELGAGSGFLSLWLCQQGARVTASDINREAVVRLRENASRNRLEPEIIQADMFDGMPDRKFDLVLVNPPYYPGDPVEEADHAWYCGADFGYFHRLFGGLGAFLSAEGRVWMVLSEDCELDTIREIALDRGWQWRTYREGKIGGEYNYIYELKPGN